MKKIIVRLNQILIVIYAHLKYWFSGKKNRASAGNKDVLIVFLASIGNAVIFLDALKNFGKLYKKEDGYKIYILCNPSTYAVFKLNQFDENYVFLNSETDEYFMKIKAFKHTLKLVSKTQWLKTVVFPYGNMIGYIAANITSNEKLSIDNKDTNCGARIYHLLDNKAYTEVIRVENDTMDLVRYATVLRHLGMRDYKAVISEINSDKFDTGFSGEYCVVDICSRSTAKMWELDKFAEVINYIIEHKKLHICIPGSKTYLHTYGALEPMITHKEYVHSYIGKTNIKGWIDLIAGAKFVLSNDTASTHIAASCGVKCICIAGYWQFGKLLPYTVETEKGNTHVPYAVMDDKDKYKCIGCENIGCFKGYGNAECRKRIIEGKNVVCISSISVKNVIDALEKVISN